MLSKKLVDIFRHLDLMSLSIPAGVLIASIIFPLRPIIRQAMIGIIFVWFGMEAMTGFSFWK